MVYDSGKYRITLKKVIRRIEGLDEVSKTEWVSEILQKLGRNATARAYHDGYEQGRFDEAIENSTPQAEIPDYVGYWLEYCKATNVGMINATYVSQYHLNNYARMSDASKLRTYFVSDKNQENFLSAWLNGYAVKKEKYYFVAVPVGRGYYKRVIVYSDYTLGLGDHNYMSLDKLKQHSRQSVQQLTEDMIKESSLSWAWQFAKELED